MQEQSGSSAAMLIVLLVVALAAGAAFLFRARRHGPDPARPASEAQPVSGPTSSSLADDLAGLADLRDKGFLSAREF